MKNTSLSLFLIAVTVVFAIISTPVFSDNTPMAQPDKGQVVFYRPSRAKGAAIRFEINNNAKGSIGQLSNGAIIQTELDPGEHSFSVRSPSVDGQDSITINVESGKTYYVKGEILWGWPAGRPKFTRMSESDAQADIEKMK
ncbi:DUF2846 domain-containing protein [Kaarinaea lacus]|jgi:hypothetical protein